ncbi:MAG: putative nitrogen fixation protein NifT [Gammaproteobacteria bacterium]
MPSVMLRRNAEGNVLFYIAKKDQEEVVETAEVDTDEQWGGELTLTDGSQYSIDPIDPNSLPITVRAKRL